MALAWFGFLAACTTPAPELVSFPETWPGRLQWIYDNSESEFLREVAADGYISQEEVQAGLEGFRACVSNFPQIHANYETNSDGFIIYRIYSPAAQTGEVHDTLNRCHFEWLGGIHYSIDTTAFWIYENPLALNRPGRIADCLVRNGLVAPTFTGGDWAEFEAQFSWAVSFSPGATNVPIDHQGPTDGELPSGLRWSSPEVRACESNWRVELDPNTLSFVPDIS